MIEKYLQQPEFKDFEDFKANYKLIVPDNFNFGYDVVDAWAAKEPDKRALLWTNDQGECREFTFGEIKKYTECITNVDRSYCHNSIGCGEL